MEPSGPTLERAKEAGKNVAKNSFAVFVAELRFVLVSFVRPFAKTLAVVGTLLFLFIVVAALGGAHDDQTLEPLSFVVLPVFALFYALAIGAPVAAVAGAFRAAWTLSGAFVLVPIVTIPLALVLSFWLLSSPLEDAGMGVVQACIDAGEAHHWLVMDFGKVGHAGPVALVILLPLLIVDLGALAFSSTVLGALAWLLTVFFSAFLLGLVPSGLLSLFAVTLGYLRRFAQRHRERLGALHQAPATRDRP